MPRCYLIAFAALLLAAQTSVDPTTRLWQHRNLGKAFYENPTTQSECVGEFKKALDLEPNSAPDVSDDAYKIMRLFRARVDRDKKTVTASFFGIQPRIAAWRPGFGAALTPGPLPTAPAPAISRGSDLHVAENATLRSVFDAAFTELGPA